MDVRGASRQGVREPYLPLQPLVQIPRLGNVNGNPVPVRQPFGINVKARERSENGLRGVDLVAIFLAGLPGPLAHGGLGLPRMGVMTEKLL